MKLYKIIYTVIPTMANSPCKIAVFTEGNRVVKVFQKDFGGWHRNVNFDHITVAALERTIQEIDEEGKRRAAFWAKQKLANNTTT